MKQGFYLSTIFLFFIILPVNIFSLAKQKANVFYQNSRVEYKEKSTVLSSYGADLTANLHLFRFVFPFEMGLRYARNIEYRTNYYQFLISVPGRTDIEVGRSINFIYPKAQTKGTEEDYQEDEKLSGLYVVTEIKHRINPVDYSMTLRIVKNGVGKSLGGIDNG